MSWFSYNNDPWRKAPLWAIELRKKLELIVTKLNGLEHHMSATDDRINEIFARFDELAAEIAKEIQQVLDAEGRSITQASKDKLDSLATKTSDFITSLRADNPPETPPATT